MCAACTTFLTPPDVLAAMCPPCPTNLMLLHLITVTMLSED
jgi:hypothetical protein